MLGIRLWLATVYCLVWLHRPRVLLSFHKGVRNGLFHSGGVQETGGIS